MAPRDPMTRWLICAGIALAAGTRNQASRRHFETRNACAEEGR
ncbi:hypothethical protein (plasmid) [Ralstonia solanacearum CMR15]|nr:hypothethical protein [Ralstonia solanacearum CMR15]